LQLLRAGLAGLVDTDPGRHVRRRGDRRTARAAGRGQPTRRRGRRPPRLPAGDVVRHACLRDGLAPVGAHPLRECLATELLRKGADLVEVSQLLRHQDLSTTMVYAKVDIGSLRAVAQPWPGDIR